MTRRLSKWLGLVCALSACREAPPPDSLRIELPEIVTGRDAVRPEVRARLKSETTSIAAEAITLSVAPAGVAVVAGDGTLRCAKTGDAKVTVEVQGVSATTALRCRLVERLEVAEVPLLDLEKGPVSLEVRVFAQDGSELHDVPVSVKAIDTTPLRVRALELTPLAVGTTALIVSVGGREERRDVRVVRGVSVKPVAIRGGRRADIDLEPGKYEIEVALERELELAMDWRGERSCAYRAKAKVHRSTCVLGKKGSVAVDNPAFLESGGTAVAAERFVVREVP